MAIPLPQRCESTVLAREFEHAFIDLSENIRLQHDAQARRNVS